MQGNLRGNFGSISGGLFVYKNPNVKFTNLNNKFMEKPFYKKTWFIVLITLLVFGTIGKLLGIDPKTSNSVTENSTPKQYVEIMKFTGTGQKKSEPFTITGSRFKIAYDCKGDTRATYCGALAYKVGSQLPQGIMNAPKPVKDETIIYDNGEYYLDVNTTGSFEMTVYDYR